MTQPKTRHETVLDLRFLEQTEPPDVVGVCRLVNGALLIRDQVGVYDPRAGGSLLGRAVFKHDGGLIYTNDGDVVTKQVA